MADPTFSWYQKYGAGGTEKADNSLRLCDSSANDPGVTEPVRIPGAGLGPYLSCCLVAAPGVSAQGDASAITDWEVYFDAQGTVEAALGTDVSIKICDQDEDPTTAQYVEATTSGSGKTKTGTAAATLYSGIISTMVQCYTFVTGARKTLNSQITSGTGEYTDWVVLQAEVDEDATFGQKGPINMYAACLVS